MQAQWLLATFGGYAQHVLSKADVAAIFLSRKILLDDLLPLAQPSWHLAVPPELPAAAGGSTSRILTSRSYSRVTVSSCMASCMCCCDAAAAETIKHPKLFLLT